MTDCIYVITARNTRYAVGEFNENFDGKIVRIEYYRQHCGKVFFSNGTEVEILDIVEYATRAYS